LAVTLKDSAHTLTMAKGIQKVTMGTTIYKLNWMEKKMPNIDDAA